MNFVFVDDTLSRQDDEQALTAEQCKCFVSTITSNLLLCLVTLANASRVLPPFDDAQLTQLTRANKL